MMPSCLTIQAFWSLKRSVTLSSSKLSGKPALNFDGGSASTLGMRKRRVPSVMASMAPVKVTQPSETASNIQPMRNRRRVGLSLPAGLAAAGLGAGFSGVVGVGSAMVRITSGDRESRYLGRHRSFSSSRSDFVNYFVEKHLQYELMFTIMGE